MRPLALASVILLALAAAVAFAQEPDPEPTPVATPTATATAPVETPTAVATLGPAEPPDFKLVKWKHSKALGRPFSNGRLVNGTQLPELGEDFFTWDPVYNRIPNREWRRYGTDRLIRTILTVIHAFRTEHDSAQRVGIMDLSRTHGGPFGRNFGGLGHASHQNGPQRDILYPRKGATEARASKPSKGRPRLWPDLAARRRGGGGLMGCP